jgi:hypothetical protein
MEGLARREKDAGAAMTTPDSTFVRYSFGNEAVEYIQSELQRFPESEGLRKLLRDLPFGSGTVFAFLPAPPPDDVVAREGAEALRHSLLYYHGGVSAVSSGYRDQELQFIAAWLQDNNRRLALFQTDYSRFEPERQPVKLAPGECVFVCGTSSQMGLLARRPEGWVFVDSRQSSHREIELARVRGMSPFPPTIGLLTYLPEDLDSINVLQELETTRLHQLAFRADYLIAEAFDGEVLLFWQAPSK